MNSVKDIARSIVAAMRTVEEECSPAVIRHYSRLATMTYADFLKRSPERTEAMNTQCLEEALFYAERAIASGASEEEISTSFARLRSYWIAKLISNKPLGGISA